MIDYAADHEKVYYSRSITVKDLIQKYIEQYDVTKMTQLEGETEAEFNARKALALKLTELVKSLATYGSAAQVYFGYRNDESTLVDKSYLTTLKDINVPELADYVVQWTGVEGKELFKYYGQTFSCKSNTMIRYAFKMLSGTQVTDYTVDFNGPATMNTYIDKSGSYVIVNVSNIAAANIDEKFEFTVKCKDEVLGTLNGAAMNYVKAVCDTPSDPEELKNLAKAIYNYNTCANVFFAQN